jgi:hypothetical protein
MTRTRTPSHRATQPELPLGRPEAGAGPAAAPTAGSPTGSPVGSTPRPTSGSGREPADRPAAPQEWRLDEETRRIGQAGIAAARAALGAPRDEPAGAVDDPRHHRASRAA